MKQLILLLLTITHGGHWLAGHTESVTVTWPTDSGLPASTLRWECKMGSISLASGSCAMPDAAHPATIKIIAPLVRTTTNLRFVYQLNQTIGDAQLATGESEIRIYPDELLSDFSSEYAEKSVVLLDHNDPLHKLLDRSKVHATTIPSISRIQMQPPDVLMIGPDEWSASPLNQPALEPLARKGMQIVIFRQEKIATLAGYHIGHRETKTAMNWRVDHALLTGLDEPTLNHWAAEVPAMAIQLPVEEAALEVGYWKPETAANQAAPIDALLVTRTIGLGRIILCQLPTDDWADDPRGQVLLHNILAYLATRPEPTPPPSQRQPAAIAPVQRERNIVISPGAQP